MIMKSVFNIHLLILIFHCHLSTFGQEINGKWISSKELTDLSEPSINILEFRKDKLYQYDFNKLIDSTEAQFGTHGIKVGDSIHWKISLNENTLNIDMPILNKEGIISFNFFKLKPTETNFNKEQIEKMNFRVLWLDSYQNLFFGFRKSDELFKLERNTDCEKISIEKIDNTFFISVFCYEKRRYVFPIVKITEQEMVVMVPSRISNSYYLKLKRYF